MNPVDARTVVVQAGAYAEHQFETATLEGRPSEPVRGPVLTVRLRPGAGGRILFSMNRYQNQPTFAFPWDRGWYGKAE